MNKFILSTVLASSIFISSIANAATGTARLISDFNDQMLKEFVKDTETLQPGDTVVIYVDSPGGYVWVEESLIAYIKLHKLKTVCEVGSLAASAAAQFISQCDQVRIADDAVLMFHLPFQQGPNGEKIREPQYTLKFLQKYGDLLKKVLSPEQYKKFTNGEDVFLTGAEFKKNIGGK